MMSAVELSAAPLGWLRRLRRPARVSPLLLAFPVALLLLGGGGWLWLRDSSLVSVDHVIVRGLSGAGAGDIRDALTRAAQGMSTLNLSPSRLRAAVAPFRIVHGLRLQAGFPHRLSILVDERPAVALLTGPGAAVPVAADGTLLQGAPLPSALPTVSVATGVVGGTVTDPGTRDELTVLGAAPSSLRAHVIRVFRGPAGITVALRSGPDVLFGDGARPHAKWQAAERVLADAGALGISYIDVREPSRPAAGLPGRSGAAGPASSLTGTAASGAALDQALQASATASAGVAAAPVSGGTSATGTPASPGASPPSPSTGGAAAAGPSGAGTGGAGTGTAAGSAGAGAAASPAGGAPAAGG